MKNLNNPAFKSVILKLIRQDFEMICLHDRLSNVGFIGADFPAITYEIFELMEIPESGWTDELLDNYIQWAKATDWLGPQNHDGFKDHVKRVYEELRQWRLVAVG